MSEIDWQADLEKKVENLRRQAVLEAEGHGYAINVTIDVSVEVVGVATMANADGKDTVPKTKKKRRSVKKNATEGKGDATGDD